MLFLGAGFSLDARNSSGEPIPSSDDLTKKLWQLCFPGDAFDDTTHLQDIFDIAVSQKPIQLTEFMRRAFSVRADSCPEWYGYLLTMPWLRIYTLNIDNLVDQVLSTKQLSRPLRVVSATTASESITTDSLLSVVHLNGTLEDLPHDVTFARMQYARRSDGDAAYAQLLNDLFLRSVVFIGSRMEENLFWRHMEMRGHRGPRGEHEVRPRSYLVVPGVK